MKTRLVLAALLLAAHAGAQTYTAVDLGTLGGNSTVVWAVNESGQATGRSNTASGALHAFLYSGGPLVDLTASNSTITFSEGRGINFSAQVVGPYATASTPTLRGFLYDAGALTDLGVPEGVTPYLHPFGINDSGWIVGEFSGGSRIDPFLIKPGLMLDLGALGGPNGGSAAAINAVGQIVGYASSSNVAWHAFRYDGLQQDLGSLGGATSTSIATAVNAAGQVVGYAYLPNGTHHAFVYTNGLMIDLGTLGGPSSEAYGINSAGQIVGASQVVGDPNEHAFIVELAANSTSPTMMTDLNGLAPAGVDLDQATGINSAGQIVAFGASRSYLLSPTQLDRFAYAWADQPSTFSYTPSSAYAYNSSGGPITISRNGTGSYVVTLGSFPLRGFGLSSAIAVSAYGSSTITCEAQQSIFMTGHSNNQVGVSCFDTATGLAADSRFDVLVVGNKSVPFLSAFVETGGLAPVPPPDPTASWTTGRIQPSALHDGPLGDYNVLLGTGNTAMSAKIVTAIGNTPTRCNYASGISGGVEVRCYDRTGAAADALFSVLQIAGGRTGRRAGFAIADLATSPSYAPSSVSAYNSSGGAITATRSSVGHYAMNFAGLGKLAGHTEHVQVVGMGTLLRTCNVVSWGNSATGLQVNVECRDGAGHFVDTRYDVLVIE